MTRHPVLVVEDEEDLREMIRDALGDHGYDVVTAREGQEALDQLTRMPRPCMVLLDLLMPGMNGWDFLERFRALPDTADVPVVIHSSVQEDLPKAATRILRKPASLEAMLAVVRELCPG